MKTSALLHWAAAATLLLCGLPVERTHGQVVTTSKLDQDPSSLPLPADFDPGRLGLNAAPMAVEGLGLQVHLPAGSKIITDRAGGLPAITVQEGALPTRWSMRIQRVTAISGGSPTPGAHVAGYLRRLEAAGVAYRVLRDAPLVCRGLEGHICYLEQSSPDGQRYVAGWLAMPTGVSPGGDVTLLEFAVLTLPEHFEEIAPLLDRSFSTIGIRSVRTVDAERQRVLGTGAALLESLTPARLRQLVGLNRWYRMYSPAAAGRGADQDLGYSLIEVSQGKKGALNPEREERQFTSAENETGLLVRVQGRVVVDSAKDSYYDSLGLYWLAWDQSSEAWSVRATHRVGDSTNTESETGIRSAPTTGDPIARITVIRAAAESFQRTPNEWTVPDVYLSQALIWVLGELMPRDPRAGELELAYYTYSGAGTPSISLRQDTWGPAGNGTGDWILSTRRGGDSASTDSVFDGRGNLVRRTRPDGSVTEPVGLAALQRYWQNQGLRMGRTR